MEVELEKTFIKQRWDFKSDQQTRQAQVDGDHRTIGEILVDRSFHQSVTIRTGEQERAGLNMSDRSSSHL
jgi:hypothetical protein